MKYTVLYKKLGENIERLRKKRGLTQEQLAELTGLNRSYFWDIEQGRNISIKTAAKIAKALGVSLSELFNF